MLGEFNVYGADQFYSVVINVNQGVESTYFLRVI